MENKPFMSSDWQKDFHIWFPGQNSLSDAERIYIQHKNRHTIITSKKKRNQKSTIILWIPFAKTDI